MGRPTIVVLDADSSVHEALRSAFAGGDVEVAAAASAGHVLDILRTSRVSVLVAEAGLLGGDPGGWIERATRLSPSLVPIVSVRNGDGSSPLLPGAFDVLDRPVSSAALRRASARALERHRLLDQIHALRRALKGRSGFAGVVGRSAAAERLRARIERVAQESGSVLFQGEPGSGRETAARALHEASPRAARPFVAVDLSAIPEGDLAHALSPAAGGGTLYLDGAGDLDIAGQNALAAALGPVDARLTASASSDLSRAIVEGLFREDLYARLAEATIHVPPLRERREDVPLIARHVAETIREINALDEIRLAPEAIDALERYRWPGNVRELRHAVEHALTVCAGGTVRVVDLPESVRSAHSGHAVSAERRFREAKRGVVDAFERSYLEDLLRRHDGNVTSAASHSGMLRSALQRLLRKHDLRSSEFRRAGRTDPSDLSS